MSDTPPDSSFVPRKEFIRDQRTANAFSLLAISGSSFIRLYSFPAVLITSLRQLFDHHGLTTAFREDIPQNLYEFTLDGKPWSSPKSVNSERLLVDILAVIYHHGYSFLSTIDYGRENDDRLAVAFSMPTSFSSSTRSGSPKPSSPLPNSPGTIMSSPIGEKAVKKVPFALSFPSATLLRVINPPLHSTPAILQAVRGSWPRGVVSERKIGDASYEFKLKGYRWFQEDTFASDSLRHILTLLSSLDTHAFTLIASLSLTNRSRVKDLWIFTGLVPFDHDTSTSDSAGSYDMSSSNIAVIKTGRSTRLESFGHVGQVPQHKRRPSAPPTGPTTYPQNRPHPYPQPPPATVHVRAATERTGPSLPHSPSGGVLRKPAPRAQVPVSVNLDAPMETEPSPHQEQFRVVLPSVISSNAENMTGVGAVARDGGVSACTPDILYTTSEQDYVSAGGPIVAAPRPRSSSPPNKRTAPRPVSTRAKTPPLLTTLSRPSSPTPRGPSPQQPPSPVPQVDQYIQSSTSTPPLLSAGVFAGDIIRDSAFSSATDASQEIPIKWTGGLDLEVASSAGKVDRSEGSKLKHASMEPQLPGAWSASPEEEKTEAATTVGKAVDIVTEKDPDAEGEPVQTLTLAQEKTPERPLHDVDARVASPELVSNADDEMRKSEAGLVGMMASPAQNIEPAPRSPTKREGGGAGWVLVNVEGKPRAEGEVQSGDRPAAHSRNASGTFQAADLTTPKSQAAATLSPATKIVIIDAKDTKLAKDKGKGKDDIRASGLKRLLSLSKRGETSVEHASESTSPPSTPRGKKGQRTPSRTRLRDRLKLKGVPEASPRSVNDKRLSIN